MLRSLLWFRCSTTVGRRFGWWKLRLLLDRWRCKLWAERWQSVLDSMLWLELAYPESIRRADTVPICADAVLVWCRLDQGHLDNRLLGLLQT